MMTTLFRLDASINPARSTTRSLADRVLDAATGELDASTVIRRDIGVNPISARAWPASVSAGGIPPEQWSHRQRQSRALADALAGELESADGFVLAAPLYNWGVSQHLKTWVDLVMTDRRFLPRTTTIAGRPAVLIVARGGNYRGDSPQAEWDHASGWMRRLFEDVWGLDLRVVDVHLTLAPHREYMAHLRDDASADLTRASSDADAAGIRLAERLRAAVQNESSRSA